MWRSERWQRAAAAVGTVAALLLVAPEARADWNWGWGGVSGSGTFTTQQRKVAGFTSLALELPAKVELVQGETEGVSIETDDNLQALIETVVEGGQLKIRTARHGKGINPKRLNITVHLRTLEKIAIGGSGDVHAAKLATPRLTISVAGSGDARIDTLEGETVEASIAGSGDVSLGGRVNEVEARVAGSGDLRLAKLQAKTVKVRIAGSGDATVWATQALAVSVAGSGDVKYCGDATVSSSVAGSGSVKRLGANP